MILCLGTTPTLARTMAFDALKIDDVNRAAAVADYAAGKNVNVARVLTTLGVPAAAIGFLGGPRAAAMRADLDTAYISHAFLDIDAPTRLCITVVDRAAKTATELIEESSKVTKTDPPRLLKQLDKLLEPANLLVLSGSLAPGVPAAFYRDCVALAGQRGVRTIVDAVGEPLTLSLPAKPFVVKPNRSELSRTVGRPIESDEHLRRAISELIALGPSWAVVTLGKDGAVVSDGRSFWRVNAPPVEPVSAIGSGDSFAAGLAAGIVRGQAVQDAAVLATACGVANTQTERSGHLTRAMVDRLRTQVKVEPWA